MEIFEITGFSAGVSKSGVNFLEPKDSYQEIQDGFIYRQVLQSRQGFAPFAPRLAGETRVMGIFEHILPDGTTELLVADKNFLYVYNTATAVFDQIAFGGSMAGYAGFNITNNDDYISGTSYPTATNGERFVFTGSGITANGAGSAVFFYNGTTVQDFTSLADNPNYAAPLIGGVSTALVRGQYVLWFNERLNIIAPTIGAITYNQDILYSGIRTVSGNGDKFNVAGAGQIGADTFEDITGASILGQVIVLNFTRSSYTAEKTRDAFNPYFIRKIPSVIGTNAKFSATQWGNEIRSLGKTGIISTDGRTQLRADNKIPYFTQDDIDQVKFNTTYGGFDRENEQFLWSYVESGSDLDYQTKTLVNNYEEETWSVYNWRFSVFGQTNVGLNLTWDEIDETTNISWGRWDTTEEIWDKIGLGEAVQKTLAGDDLGFIYELNKDYDDYFTTISAITQAAQAVLTVAASGFKAGDLVVVQNVEGMTEINNFDPDPNIDQEQYIENLINFEPWTVVSATPTSVTLNVDSTLFTAYTTGGTLSKLINFSAKTIPFNPWRDQGRRVIVSHVEFLLDTNGGSLEVSVFDDEEEEPFITDILCIPTSTTKAREWVTMTVNNEANFMTFLLRQSSPAVQVKLTSMRIHAMPGGYTSG